MQEGYGADKLPNDYILGLVIRHQGDIASRVTGFSNIIIEEKVEDFFNVEIKTQQSLGQRKDKGPSLPTKGSQRDLTSITKSSRNLPTPPAQDAPAKEAPRNDLKKSKSTTEETQGSRSGSQVLDKSLVRSRRASGFAPGPPKNSLVPRSDRSIKDVPREPSQRDSICKSMKEIANKNDFNWNEDGKDVRPKSEPETQLPPTLLPNIKVISYRTQVELGLNYLIRLEVSGVPCLAVIRQKQNLQATELTRVSAL